MGDPQSTSGSEQCDNCGGTGMVAYSAYHYAGTAQCPDCDGEGAV